MYRHLAWLIPLFAAFTLSCATAAQADFGAGQTAWKAGRYAEAMKEWRRAARAGDRRAMAALGRAFVRGVGVPQDFIEAHKWLNLAAARGDEKAAAERDALAKEMTVEERAEARKLLRAWRTAGKRRSTAIVPRRRTPGTPRPPRRMARKGSPGNAALRAVAAGNISALDKALAAGADPNARGGKRGWTPLMFAADKGYTLLVPPLLKAGAKPNLRAADGATALFIAALRGHSEIIAALMKAGADPAIKGPKGKTAEEVGYIGKNPRVIEALGLIKTIPEPNGMVWKGAVLRGERHGRWTKTKADGTVVGEGPYVKGKKHGQWKERHRDEIELGLWFSQGGEPPVQTENDERLETGPYVEGERHGGWTLSAKGDDGKLRFRLEGPYVKGKKHGRWKVRQSHGRWEGSYVRGKRHGPWKHTWGAWTVSYYYKGGKKHGPYTADFRTDHLRITLQTAYVDDLLHGPYVYESNSPDPSTPKYSYTKGMYVMGKKHGKWRDKARGRNYRGGTYENYNWDNIIHYDNGRRIRKSPQNQEAATGDDDNTANED